MTHGGKFTQSSHCNCWRTALAHHGSIWSRRFFLLFWHLLVENANQMLAVAARKKLFSSVSLNYGGEIFGPWSYLVIWAICFKDAQKPFRLCGPNTQTVSSRHGHIENRCWQFFFFSFAGLLPDIVNCSHLTFIFLYEKI